MKSRVHKSKSPVSLKHAVKQWWGKSLTSSLYPDVKCWQKDCDVGDADSVFQPGYVREVAQFLRHLAVVGIDKCMGRSLIL